MMIELTPKKITIHAKLYEDDNLEEILEFCGDNAYVNGDGILFLKTLEGDEEVFKHEYVKKGVLGEFTAVPYDKFRSIYINTHEDEWEVRGILALLYTGRNFKEIQLFTQNLPGLTAYDRDEKTGICKIPHPKKKPYILKPGNYVIWKNDRMYPCTPEALYQTYDTAEV